MPSTLASNVEFDGLGDIEVIECPNEQDRPTLPILGQFCRQALNSWSVSALRYAVEIGRATVDGRAIEVMTRYACCRSSGTQENRAQ